MFARTARLLLRPGWAEDAPALAHAIRDEAIVRNLATAPWPYALGDAEAFLACPRDPVLPSFLIIARTAGSPEIVGACGITRRASGRVELGYWIARSHWNKGYATEAARSILRLAGTLRHKRVAAHHFVDNPASARVLAKIGFRPTGTVALRTSVARERPALAATHAVSLPIADCDNFGGTDGAGEKVARPMPRRAA